MSDFGPIANGTVEFRPLTILVGPSNTGKTYLSILLYALHRSLSGFPRHPFGNNFYTASNANFSDALDKLFIDGRPLESSDIPTDARNQINALLSDNDFYGNDIASNLKHCFDLDSVADLIRSADQCHLAEISIDVSKNGHDLWGLDIGLDRQEKKSTQDPYDSESGDVDEDDVIKGISTKGRVYDMTLISGDWAAHKSRMSKEIHNLRNAYNAGRTSEELTDFMFQITAPWTENESVYYLPAARSGIMQSHRLIASALMGRATRVGLEAFPELPVLSGVLADFLRHLTVYGDSSVRHKKTMNHLARDLESRALLGTIEQRRGHVQGYPSFVYRPKSGDNKNYPMSRVSSMVTELAPIVLFLRGFVGRWDTLIIEEPEAHLHPAVQTEIAVTVAQLVRSGVRVVITTHSDWFLKTISTLILEGKLSDHDGVRSFPNSLRPADVGVWLFRQDDAAGGSEIEEIPFDLQDGIEPQDYNHVAEVLYNKSADLQNRLGDISCLPKR